MTSIDESLAQKLKHQLWQLRENGIEAVDTEIQDDGEFILVTVAVDESELGMSVSEFLAKAAESVSPAVPSRTGDFSWMINIRSSAGLIDSISGGMRS